MPILVFVENIFLGERSPLLTRRGGCGIKKLLAKPHLSAADGVVAHKSQSGVTDHPVRSASTPPHEEGTTLAQKNALDKN